MTDTTEKDTGRDGIRWVVFCAMYPGEERMFDDRSTSEIRAMNSRASGVADALWLAGARVNADTLAALVSDGLADKVRALADEWHERAKARSDAWTPLYQDHAAALRALLPADTQDTDQ